jgi:hypothetical protein
MPEPTVRYCLVTGFECLTCEPGECRLIFSEDAPAKSVAIERLIEEVRNADATGAPNAYNRIYSRHNRS